MVANSYGSSPRYAKAPQRKVAEATLTAHDGLSTESPLARWSWVCRSRNKKDLHSGDRSLSTGRDRDSGEGRLGAGRLDVVQRQARRDNRDLRSKRSGRRDDLGAVNERVDVLAKHSHLRHRRGELGDHRVLISWCGSLVSVGIS